MVQPEAGFAEKYRRLMEALEIEADYGQTTEVYQQSIMLDEGTNDQMVMVDILRVGRLALFFRTPNGQKVGHWDRANEKWALLPDKYRRNINSAMEMALRRRTVEMVKLPLGRITPQ